MEIPVAVAMALQVRVGLWVILARVEEHLVAVHPGAVLQVEEHLVEDHPEAAPQVVGHLEAAVEVNSVKSVMIMMITDFVHFHTWKLVHQPLRLIERQYLPVETQTRVVAVW